MIDDEYWEDTYEVQKMMNILETRQEVGTDITWYNFCHGYQAKKDNSTRPTDDGVNS